MTAHPGRGRTLVAVAATVLAGVGVATQSRINGELGQRFDDGFTAALVSFSSGWVVLLVIAEFFEVLLLDRVEEEHLLAAVLGRLGLRDERGGVVATLDVNAI